MSISGELMTPDEVLHWLDYFGIHYKVQKGAFVTAKSIMLADDCKQKLPNLIRSIAEHADALAEECQRRAPDKCNWCHLDIPHGTYRIRVYVQEDGRRYSFHRDCHAQRAEKMPDLPMPDIFLDFPGYTVLFEDTGLCCYCQMAEATLPAKAPNVCNRCWKIRDRKKQAVHTGTGTDAA